MAFFLTESQLFNICVASFLHKLLISATNVFCPFLNRFPH